MSFNYLFGRPNVITFTISGVSSADIVGGQLTISYTLFGDSGLGSFSIGILGDGLTEGPETLVVTYNSGNTLISGSVYVEDTSTTRDISAGFRITNGSLDSDTIRGGDGADLIFAYTGNNSIVGGGGNDVISAESGNDALDGGPGDDELYGGMGDDKYWIDSRRDFIFDSGGRDTAIVSASFCKIPSSIETVLFINGSEKLPYWIDALLPDEASGLGYIGSVLASKTFFYAFPQGVPQYYSGKADAAGFLGFDPSRSQRVESILSYIASIIDVNFIPTSDPTSEDTITFAFNSQAQSAGYAYPPYPASEGSDIFISRTDSDGKLPTFLPGTYSALAIIHEIGHAIGLKHPFSGKDATGGVEDPPYLTSTEDNTRWTIMSYTSSSAQYFSQYRELDIAALHYLYGPSKTSRIGNDTYTISTTEPNFIWDGGGTDTVSVAGCNQSCTVYLTPGYWGHVGASKSTHITAPGQITVNFGTVIENLIGSTFGDMLVGNDVSNSISGGFGNDTIDGGAGADTLIGGQGDDSLVGGSGLDVVVLNFARGVYTLSVAGQRWVVSNTTGTDGRDEVSGVERLKFSDSWTALDLGTRDSAGSAVLLIGAVLGKDLMLSKRPLMGSVIDLFDQGYTIQQLAGALMRLPIWAGTLTPTNSSTDIASYLLTRVNGKAPTAAELASAVRSLDSDVQGTFLANLALTEANVTQVDLVGLSKVGFDYPLGG